MDLNLFCSVYSGLIILPVKFPAHVIPSGLFAGDRGGSAAAAAVEDKFSWVRVGSNQVVK